jgi:hypothetical protein
MTIQAFKPCFSGVTATQTAPTDANSTPSADTATTCTNGLRGQQFMMEFDFRGSSGTVTATVELYLWDADFRRWAKAATPISLSSTSTSSGPASRFCYALDSIQPFAAVLPVVSAISGTGATLDCRLGLTGPN